MDIVGREGAESAAGWHGLTGWHIQSNPTPDTTNVHRPQQFLAVQDVLKGKNIGFNDGAARDAALQPELAAAVAGAGKAVLDKVAPAGATFYQQVFETQVSGWDGSTNRLGGGLIGSIDWMVG